MQYRNVVVYIWKMVRYCAIASCTIAIPIAHAFPEIPSPHYRSNSYWSNPDEYLGDEQSYSNNTPKSVLEWPKNFLTSDVAWSQERVDGSALRQAWATYWIKKDHPIVCDEERTPIWMRVDPPKEFIATKENQWLTALQWIALAQLCNIPIEEYKTTLLSALQQHRALDPQNSWIYVLRVHYWIATNEKNRIRVDMHNVVALDQEKKWQEVIGLGWHMLSWREEQIAKKAIVPINNQAAKNLQESPHAKTTSQDAVMQLEQ